MSGGPPRLGASDCELVHHGLLAQPVAATSSLAYVAVGLWLLGRSGDTQRRDRRAARVYAGLLGLVGAGSVLYHGPQWPGSRVLHDVPIALVATQAVVVPLARVAAGGPAFRTAQSASLTACGTLAGAALVAYLAGRTGGPLCDPGSRLQPHAAWHVAGALALGIWGTVLWPAPSDGGHRWRRRSRGPGR